MRRAKDWRVVIDDTGGPYSGWPCVWSDTEDRSVLHVNGFIQEHWTGPSLDEAMAIAQVVADFMNGGRHGERREVAWTVPEQGRPRSRHGRL